MAFDFFIQPRGPEVNVSLFGDAATQGANVGKAIPSPISAAIQGVTTGLEKGLDFYEQSQQAVIRQNEIEQLPTTNELRREQLESQILENDINKLKLDLQLKTGKLQEEATIAKLKSDIAKAESTIYDQALAKEINYKLNSSLPHERADVLRNPRYKDYLFKNPKIAESILGRLRGDLTPEEVDKMYGALNVSKDIEFQRKQEAERQRQTNKLNADYDKLENEMLAGSVYSTYGNKYRTPDEISDAVEVVPKGLRATDENGKVLRDKNGVPIEQIPDSEDAAKEATQYYEVFENGVKKPLLLNQKDGEQYNRWRNANRNRRWTIREDTYGRQAPQAQEQTATSTQVPTEDIAALSDPVVREKRKQYESMPAPSGVNSSTRDQRLREQKAMRQKAKAQQTAFTLDAHGVDRQSYLNLVSSNETPVEQVSVKVGSSPSQVASSYAGLNVSLNLDTEYPLASSQKSAEEVYTRVTSEPLLQNKGPLLKGLATVESGGKRDATSPTGVKGLLQVSKATAADYGLNRDIPEENVQAGSVYFYDQLVRYKGNIKLALAAYNSGQGTINEAIKATQSTDWAKIKAYLKETLSAKKYEETAAFPDKVISASMYYLGANKQADADYLSLLQRNNIFYTEEGASSEQASDQTLTATEA